MEIQKESNKIKDSSKECIIKEIHPYIDSQANMKSHITWGGCNMTSHITWGGCNMKSHITWGGGVI